MVGGGMRSVSFTGLVAAAVIAVGAPAFAQTPVRTEIIRPPRVPPITQRDIPPPEITGAIPARKPPLAPAPGIPEVIFDLDRLPPPVARMRERILTAARSGRLEELVAVMRSNDPMPIFSLKDERDPTLYWRSNYPDSGGVEVLATLTDILETGFVHIDEGTPQEMYVWPYFARRPLDGLPAEQKVALLRIVTGADYREMVAAGGYNFFRLGIGADGVWRFFVTGD
jgi:hypothetical protein